MVLVFLFGFVLLIGAPYLPTKKLQIKTALDLLDLKKGQTLLDLGCGDGRVLKLAARQGIKGVGYEANPLLWVVACLNTWKHRSTVSIKCSNYWTSKWPRVSGIYMFLGEKHMAKLHKNFVRYDHKPLRVASYAFRLEKANLIKEQGGVYLYLYQ